MTAPWATCCRCDVDLYPRLARRTDEGWVCGSTETRACAIRVAKAAAAKTRIEDIQWMVDTGENAIGAARRLGITRKCLDTFCRRNGLATEWRQLIERDPRDHNVYVPNYERKAS